MKVALREERLRFREPVHAAWGVLEERQLLVLELDGRACGEAAPLEGYDGVPLEAVRAALEDCRGVLEAADAGRVAEGGPGPGATGRGNEGGPGAGAVVAPRGVHAELLAACRERAVLPQAVAAVDMALWELAGGPPRGSLARVPVNATVAAPDRAGAAAAAAAAVGAGYRCIKLKVGLGDDPGRVAAVRAAVGPHVALRLDANGAWTVDEAVAMLRALAPAGVELCEEPVHGIEGVGAVRAAGTGVPVAMDETARLPGALESGAAELVCLKVAGCGGVSGVLEAAARTSAEVYVASTYDGPLGIAAGLRAASLLGVRRACGLATLNLYEGRPAVSVVDGTMEVP